MFIDVQQGPPRVELPCTARMLTRGNYTVLNGNFITQFGVDPRTRFLLGRISPTFVRHLHTWATEEPELTPAQLFSKAFGGKYPEQHTPVGLSHVLEAVTAPTPCCIVVPPPCRTPTVAPSVYPFLASSFVARNQKIYQCFDNGYIILEPANAVYCGFQGELPSDFHNITSPIVLFLRALCVEEHVEKKNKRVVGFPPQVLYSAICLSVRENVKKLHLQPFGSSQESVTLTDAQLKRFDVDKKIRIQTNPISNVYTISAASKEEIVEAAVSLKWKRTLPLRLFKNGNGWELRLTARVKVYPLRCACCCKFPCCQDQTTFKGCGNCMLVYYCSKVCQTTHWKVHKTVCKVPSDAYCDNPGKIEVCVGYSN